MIQQPVNYSNAEVRGRLRAWKNVLHQHYQRFSAAFTNNLASVDCVDLVKRGSRAGRERAVNKLQKAFGPTAKLEHFHDGKHPYALWSILKPSGPMAVNASDESGHNQFCVTVNYVMAGWIPTEDAIGRFTGLWTLEVPDHALGRAVERSGLIHPETIIRSAHLNLLNLPTELVSHDGLIGSGRGFFVKAGAGAFRCEICAASNELTGGLLGIYVFTPTWLDNGQLHEDQIPLCKKGNPGQRLGDEWLLPSPLRHIVKTADGWTFAVWQDNDGGQRSESAKSGFYT